MNKNKMNKKYMNTYFNSPSYIHYSYYGVREEYYKLLEREKEYREESRHGTVGEICYCNPKNTELDTLILSFSYLLTDCNKCLRNYRYDCNYESDDEFDGNNKGTYQEFKKLIKKKPELVFIKNNFGLYPLELVDLIDQTLFECYHSYSKIRGFAEVSFTFLCKIRNDLWNEYLKAELVKSVAFRYIKNSNHIGNNSKLLQLPMEIWDHIFTFI